MHRSNADIIYFISSQVLLNSFISSSPDNCNWIQKLLYIPNVTKESGIRAIIIIIKKGRQCKAGVRRPQPHNTNQ